MHLSTMLDLPELGSPTNTIFSLKIGSAIIILASAAAPGKSVFFIGPIL